MIHHKAIIALILLVTTTLDTHAQTYNWEIENTQHVYEKDTNKIRTTRTSTSTITVNIESVSNAVIRVTIDAVKLDAPNTSFGPITFDSNDPAKPDDPFDVALRSVVGLSFTLTYDKNDRILKPSEELSKNDAASVFGQTLTAPYLTTPFAPFLIFQGDATPTAPRTFMLMPYAQGIEFDNPTLIDYATGTKADTLHTHAEPSTEGEADLPGASSRAKLSIKGKTTATHDKDSLELKEHTYSITSDLRFDYKPGMPVHAEMITKATIKRVPTPAP